MSGGVVAAANTTPQPPPQVTANIAKVTPQIATRKTPKVMPQPAPQIAAAATTVAKVTTQEQPQVMATKVAKVTPEPPPQISAAMLAMPPSSSLSLEQMRTAGAVAGARQRAKLAANKRL